MACAQHFDTRLADMLEVWDARCIWIGVGIFLEQFLLQKKKKEIVEKVERVKDKMN